MWVVPIVEQGEVQGKGTMTHVCINRSEILVILHRDYDGITDDTMIY